MTVPYYLETIFSSGGGFNTFHYRNPEVDALLEQAQYTLRDTDRLPLLHKTIQTIHRDMPVVALYNLYETYAVSRILDWEPRADGFVLGKDIRFKR